MAKAFKNPFFIAGLPLVICGFTFGLIGMLSNSTFSYIAAGLLVPGLAMVGSALIKLNRP